MIYGVPANRYFNVDYPSNVKRLLEIFSAAFLAFIPNPFEFLVPNSEKYLLSSPPSFAEDDVSGLFLQASGTSLIIWILVILIFGLYKLVKYLFRNCRGIQRLKKLKKYFGISTFLRICIGTY